MNCLSCQKPMPSSTTTESCPDCFIHFFPKYPGLNEAHYYFITKVESKTYEVQYFLDPKEMAVYDWDTDTVLFKVPYTEPRITPFNAATRLPALITFS